MRACGCPVRSHCPHGISLQLCYITANSPQEALPIRQQPALLSLICFCGTSSAPWAHIQHLKGWGQQFPILKRRLVEATAFLFDRLTCHVFLQLPSESVLTFILWDRTQLIFLQFAGFLLNLLLWNSYRKKAQREGLTWCRVYKRTDQKEFKIWLRRGGAPAETQYDALQEG